MRVPSGSGKLLVSNDRYSSDRTHVKDLKNLVEVQSPGNDLSLVSPCMEVSRNFISVFLLDDILLDLRHSPSRVR